MSFNSRRNLQCIASGPADFEVFKAFNFFNTSSVLNLNIKSVTKVQLRSVSIYHARLSLAKTLTKKLFKTPALSLAEEP